MMRNRILLLTIFIFMVGALNGQIVQSALFLGNSYTYVNDLPGIIQKLAESGGDSLIKDQNTPGGYSLEGHSTNATSLSKIQAGNWDFVILQDQSQRPSLSQNQVWQYTYPFAERLVDSIKAANPCTEPLFYMTWGRENGDQANCPYWFPSCTFEGMSSQLRLSYLNMANWNDATVAPVGVAWREARSRDTLLSLYAGDGSHPNYTGSYLTACVFYATMYGKSPVGLSFWGTLDTTMAVFLQDVAADVVFDSLDTWRIGHANVLADFSFMNGSQGIVNFADSSQNATSWTWNFGDGSPVDTNPNPMHQYGQSGTYTVQLVVSNACMSDTIWDTVFVSLLRMDAEGKLNFEIWPNPGIGDLHIEAGPFEAGMVEIVLWNFEGKRLWSRKFNHDGGLFRQSLDFQDISGGLYNLEMKAGNNFWRKSLYLFEE